MSTNEKRETWQKRAVPYGSYTYWSVVCDSRYVAQSLAESDCDAIIADHVAAQHVEQHGFVPDPLVDHDASPCEICGEMFDGHADYALYVKETDKERAALEERIEQAVEALAEAERALVEINLSNARLAQGRELAERKMAEAERERDNYKLLYEVEEQQKEIWIAAHEEMRLKAIAIEDEYDAALTANDALATALEEGRERGFVEHEGACQGRYGGEDKCGFFEWEKRLDAALARWRAQEQKA